MSSADTLLSVRDLAVHFVVGARGMLGRGGKVLRAVDGVSFDIERGGALGLVGESGSGKTTTARAVIGLERPTAGSIRLDGVEFADLSRREWFPHRRRMQMVFQDPYGSLDPRQKVGSILAEPLAIHRVCKPRERRTRALALLDAVGLSAEHLDRYPHEFSGGQRQRIGIARALALEPEVLICDEPVSALDVSIQAQIVNLLKELQGRFGLALLFIAHDLAVVRHLCDEIAVMYLGRIVEIAPRTALFGDPKHPYTRALLSAIPVADPAVERLRERIVLAGDPPSPTDPPPGCRFHPRCAVRERVPGDRCRREDPLLLPVLEDGSALPSRLAACHAVPREESEEPASARIGAAGPRELQPRERSLR